MAMQEISKGVAEAVRRDFAYPARGIAWLDNAATTQRPEAVIAAMRQFFGEG